MTKKTKMCLWCKKNEARVPINRGSPRRFVKEICEECHSSRLIRDFKIILHKSSDR